jgi:hypothetical protein
LVQSKAAGATDPDIRRDATVIAIEKVLPSVVNIATETVIEYHEWYTPCSGSFMAGHAHRCIRKNPSASARESS